MPAKKNPGSQKTSPPQEAQSLPDISDPALVAVAIVDKKKRNLEKRKNKLEALKEELEGGTNLAKDQLAAVARLNEVNLQLELVKELQKQFTTLQSDYQKSRKKASKAEKLAAKESERESERRAVIYTMRLQDILNSIGDQDKENFKNGTNGAVTLSDTELGQLDELYRLLTPARQGNPNYSSEVVIAGECIQQLLEQSTKDVLGSTYKQLYDLIERIDSCGYFDRAPSDNGDEESQEEGVAEEDDYKSAEDTLANEEYIEPAPPAVSDFTPPAVEPVMEPQPPSPVVQPPMISGFVPAAPSPTFPGLGPSPLHTTVDAAFSFMHDSEVERGAIQAIPQQAAAPLDGTLLSGEHQLTYSSYGPSEERLASEELGIMAPDGRVIPHPAANAVDQPGTGDLGATDVTTGQPHQTPANTYQAAITNNPGLGAYLNSQGGINGPNSNFQEFGAPVRMSGNRGPKTGGGGSRRPQGGQKNGGGGGAVYRNGRGRGYDEQFTGYNRTTAYSGSSGGFQHRGRPNYQTANTGNRK